MSRTLSHELQPAKRHDDAARQRFILSLKGHVSRHIRPVNRELFDRDVAPAFEAEHGRPPRTRDEIREKMNDKPIYQTWGALQRCSQDEMWMSMLDMIEADYDRMTDAANRLGSAPDKRGSLDIPDDFKVPADLLKANIHGQPGGYDLDLGDNDVTAGALYESGGSLYSQGAGIGIKESKAHRVIEWMRERFPDLTPRRILEMGCSAGGQTVVYPMEFPDAEVHAIDAAPPLVRYGHLKAESLGVAVHFHAMDAEHMTFPDAHFDLVVSHNMFHEVSGRGALPILKEAHRVLKPGGVLLNQDLAARADHMTLFDQFLAEWETFNNDEPFFTEYMEANFSDLLVKAGFDADAIFDEFVAMRHAGATGPQRWYVFGGRKASD